MIHLLLLLLVGLLLLRVLQGLMRLLSGQLLMLWKLLWILLLVCC